MQAAPDSADSQAMDPIRDDVILIDDLGQSLRLNKGQWQEILQMAEMNGWRPAGMAPPPQAWGITVPPNGSATCDGGYSEPRGQLVVRADAAHMAAALRSSPRLPPSLDRVVRFCARGGFIICPLTQELHAYLNSGLQSSPSNH